MKYGILIGMLLAISCVAAADNTNDLLAEEMRSSLFPQDVAESTDSDKMLQCHPNTCTDTDGGIEPFVQGTVSGYLYGFPYAFTDFCLVHHEDKLVEFFCEDGFCGMHPELRVMDCEYGCVDGKCNEPPVPEFGTAALVIAATGAVGAFLFLRRR